MNQPNASKTLYCGTALRHVKTDQSSLRFLPYQMRHKWIGDDIWPIKHYTHIRKGKMNATRWSDDITAARGVGWGRLSRSLSVRGLTRLLYRRVLLHPLSALLPCCLVSHFAVWHSRLAGGLWCLLPRYRRTDRPGVWSNCVWDYFEI